MRRSLTLFVVTIALLMGVSSRLRVCNERHQLCAPIRRSVRPPLPCERFGRSAGPAPSDVTGLRAPVICSKIRARPEFCSSPLQFRM